MMLQALHPAGFDPQDVRDLLPAVPGHCKLKFCSSNALCPCPAMVTVSQEPQELVGLGFW